MSSLYDVMETLISGNPSNSSQLEPPINTATFLLSVKENKPIADLLSDDYMKKGSREELKNFVKTVMYTARHELKSDPGPKSAYAEYKTL